MDNQTYDWIKQIPSAVLHLDEIPLFGTAPSFPWNQFSSEMANTYQIESLSVQPMEMQWRTADQLLAGLPGTLIPLYFHFTPLEGNLCWVMSQTDVDALMYSMLTKQPKAFESMDPH